jgi:hypothetical protein
MRSTIIQSAAKLHAKNAQSEKSITAGATKESVRPVALALAAGFAR